MSKRLNLPKGWCVKKLGEIASIKTGKSNTCDAVKDGLYVFFDRSKQPKRSNKYLFDTTAIIVPGEGKEFFPRFFSGKFDLHQRAYAIFDFSAEVVPRYIYYYILSSRKYFEKVAVGSTVKSLRLRHFKEMPVILPPLSEQERIVDILGSIDDQIENLAEQNKTLEEMAKTIFRRWFIEFEFPNEKGRPYKSSGGRFIDSKLGKIPKGWKICKVEELAEIGIGKTPPRKEPHWFSDKPGVNTVRWVSIRDLGSAHVYILNSAEHLVKEAISKFKIKLVPDNAVLLSFKLTVGRVAITIGDMVTNEAIAHFRIKDKAGLTIPYFYKYLRNFNYSLLGSSSSIANAISSKMVRAMPVLVPPVQVVEQFTKKVDSIFQLIRSNVLRIETLTNLRECLLSNLVVKEIEVGVGNGYFD